MGGFAEGKVVGIAANAMNSFACTIDGAVFYNQDDHWNEIKMNGGVDDDDSFKSMDLAAIAACDHCCFGVGGSDAFFLFPPDNGDDSCHVIKRDLGDLKEVLYMDGSGSHAVFLVLNEENDNDSNEEYDENSLAGADDKEEDTKPAAVEK